MSLENVVTRRELLRQGSRIAGLGAVAYAARPYAAFAQPQRKLNFFDALFGDLETQQRYLNQVLNNQLPSQVSSIGFLNQELSDKLKTVYGFVLPDDAVGAVLPLELGSNDAEIKIAPLYELGKGVKAKLLLNPRIFRRIAVNASDGVLSQSPESERKFAEECEKILYNKLNNNMFVQAQYFNTGIPGYGIEMFVESNGGFNYDLYTSSIRILSLSKEYLGLLGTGAEMRYVQIYASSIKRRGELLLGAFKKISTKELRPELIRKLGQDFQVDKLFPDPRRFRQA